MKHLPQFISIILLVFSFACGGSDSKEKEKTDTTQAKEKSKESTENTSEGEKVCFAAEEQLTKAYANLIFKGNTISGTMRYETPKAGMTLYEICNVKGTKDKDKLTLTLTTVDTDTGQGIGESREEIWFMQGEELTQKEENVTGALKKITCPENATFKAETPKAEASKSYQFDGIMNGKLKVKLFLTSKPNPEDKKTLLYEGYYYYLNQGKDKKIDLKGIANTMGFLQLDEVVGNKTFGKFMIESAFELGDEFTCTWVSADSKKELQTVFKSAK